jgi:sulfonate transport system substrate-binding protein
MTMTRAALRILVVGLMLATVTACGAARGANEQSAPAVTLHVGTLGTTKALFEASGVGKDLPYRLEWSTFPTGPRLVEAARAKAVDIGQTAEIPPIFAQAANTPVKIVAAEKLTDPGRSPLAIVVPKESPIAGVAQLKGRKVGVTQGTIVQYFAIKVLQRAGLAYSDITPVNLSPADGVAALRRGDIDAMSLIDPTLARATATIGARVLVTGAGYTAGVNYQLIRTDVLADSGRAGAVVDFLRRSVRARRWANSHPQEWAAAYAKANNIPLDLAAVTTARAQFDYVPIDDGIIAAQQDEADVFFQLGLLPRPIAVRGQFDPRFNGRLT